MSDSEKKEVFLSYNQKNVDQAQYLCNMLEGAGISCWMAPRDIPPGQSWAASIIQGISDCRIMALLVSSTSLTSPEVAKEVDLANTCKKEILPVRVEDIPFTGPLQYHLSTRQWVDAFQGEKLIRFQDAMAAVLRMLDRSDASAIGDASVLGQARALVARLNQRHAHALDTTNAMFSARGSDTGKVSIFYPQRIGATGIDLISEFDCNQKSMQIYGRRLSDGDPFKYPFNDFIEGKYKKDRLPTFKRAEHARNIQFATLLPPTALTTALLNESAEECFPRFARHVEVLSDTVLIDLIAWTVYAKEVTDAIEDLHRKLQAVFPATDGWRVGVPEGGHLATFRKGGRINVFKAPNGATEEQGLLSITLQADDNFLRSLKLGILKREAWHDLGAWEQRLFDAAKALASSAEARSGDGWPYVTSLDAKWSDAGLWDAKPLWRGKLDQFVDTVVGEFVRLKALQPLLDQAAAAIPGLQDKDPGDIPESGRADWGTSALYIRNRLRQLAETVRGRNTSPRVTVDFRFRFSESECNDLYLAVKVGKFDAAISFAFNSHKATVKIGSLEAPDLETAIVTAFFAKRHPGLPFAGLPGGHGLYHGLTLPAWLDKYEALVEEHMDAYLQAMDDLALHLQRCCERSEEIVGGLHAKLPAENGWIIENAATHSLEAGVGISIYNRAWIGPNSQPQDTPSLMVQILPNKPCFDKLWISVSFLGQTMQALERSVGKIVGACDFAFRELTSQDGQPPSNGIWAQPVKAPLLGTGGGLLAENTPTEADLTATSSGVQAIASTIEQLGPIFLDACQTYHEVRFKTEYEAFIDKLVTGIGGVFPKEDGWVVTTDDLKSGKRYGKVIVYHSAWQKGGAARGCLSFVVEGDSPFFDNLYYGIVKSERAMEIPSSGLEELRQACDQQFNGSGRFSDLWVSWRYADPAFRLPGGSKKQMRPDAELQSFVSYFVGVFQQLKCLKPAIDTILADQRPATGSL